MTKWIDVNEELPKYSGLYLVYCNIGSMLGGYKDVRAYDYSIIGIVEK